MNQLDYVAYICEPIRICCVCNSYVIVLLVYDMMYVQHEARPKGECYICIISQTKRTIPVISPVTMAYLAFQVGHRLL